MLLDLFQLIYEPFSILIRDLVLVLMTLYVRRIFFLLRKLHTSFLHLPIFILLGKNGKSLCKSCNLLEYLMSTSRIYPLSLFSS